MVPIITAITSDHWSAIINTTTSRTNPYLIFFICLYREEKKKNR